MGRAKYIINIGETHKVSKEISGKKSRHVDVESDKLKIYEICTWKINVWNLKSPASKVMCYTV